jgi:hypothetical protein
LNSATTILTGTSYFTDNSLVVNENYYGICNIAYKLYDNAHNLIYIGSADWGVSGVTTY